MFTIYYNIIRYVPGVTLAPGVGNGVLSERFLNHDCCLLHCIVKYMVEQHLPPMFRFSWLNYQSVSYMQQGDEIHIVYNSFPGFQAKCKVVRDDDFVQIDDVVLDGSEHIHSSTIFTTINYSLDGVIRVDDYIRGIIHHGCFLSLYPILQTDLDDIFDGGYYDVLSYPVQIFRPFILDSIVKCLSEECLFDSVDRTFLKKIEKALYKKADEIF